MRPELEKQTTKDMLINQGLIPLTKKELEELIVNNTVCGDYEYNGHRKYKSFIDKSGKLDGKNDWGSHEYGHWVIDKDGYLILEWEGYWEDCTTVAFKVDDEIKFYNVDDGKWRTTFNKILEGKHDLDVVVE